MKFFLTLRRLIIERLAWTTDSNREASYSRMKEDPSTSMISLGSNISSLKAQRRLAEGQSALVRSFEKLSSGMRINRASDDAAGLAVSSSLSSRSRVYGQAVRNGNDGLSVLSIVDGALQQLSALTTRQLELANQAANGSFSFGQRAVLHREAASLTEEFNRILGAARFNSQSLLTRVGEELRLQLGFGTDGGIAMRRNASLGRTVGTGTFGQHSALSSDYGNVHSIADLNGDGLADIVYGSTISFNQGNGTFNDVAINSDGQSLIADINGDGRMDVVTYQFNGSALKSYLSNGDGTFTFTGTFSAASPLHFAVSGDFNGDGNVDLLTRSVAGTSVYVSFGNGDGTFSAAAPTGQNIFPQLGHIADFNRDGRDDLLIGTSLMMSNGDGSFSTPVSVGAGTPRAVGDLNGDGYPDVVVLNGANLSFLINDGSGGFESVSGGTLAEGWPNGVALQDINGDGHLDLVTGTATGLYTRLNDGSGSFGERISTSRPNLASDVSLLLGGDFNGDGSVDMVFISEVATMAAIFYSDTTQTTSAEEMNLYTQADARRSITLLERQLARIGREQGTIGALMSRIEAAIENLKSLRENVDAAQSRITDVDVAAESALIVQRQILQDSGAAVLAQANQMPALALQLLAVPSQELG